MLDNMGTANAHARAIRIFLLVLLAVIAYLPALRLPFLEDDYVMIPMSNVYAAQHWAPLWHDLDFRTRPMQLFMNVAVDRMFGYRPLPYYAANILLHVLCVLLVYAAGVWTELGFTASLWAAGFFAVYEGHQEAIMWPSASSELFVFLFSMAAWVCWVKWLQGGHWRWHAAAVSAFVLALFSKESAVVLPALLLIPGFTYVSADRGRWHRVLAGIPPFFALAALYVLWIWISRIARPGYGDVRFSLSSPWLLVIAKSFWRMVMVWGLAAAAILWAWGGRGARRMTWIASLWMLLGMLPYSFLSYMTQLPSRSTYLASAGLALLVGSAAVALQERRRRALLVILTTIVLAVNLEILWVKKMSQFRERSEPSELLKQAAAQASGPISIECTPLLPIIAEVVVEQAGGKIAAEQERREEHCFAIHYESRTGERVSLNRPMGTSKHGLFY
jgi:hypothetical protein